MKAEKLAALVVVSDRDGVPVEPLPTDARVEEEAAAS